MMTFRKFRAVLLFVTCLTFYTIFLQSSYRNPQLYSYSNKIDDLENIVLSENGRLAEEEIRAGEFRFRLNPNTSCYEVEGQPAIWLYWDTDQVPWFARILADAVQCVNREFRVILVHDSNLRQFWRDFPAQFFRRLISAHKSDVVRVNLLRIYGGIYLDVDTIPIQSYYPYYKLLPAYDLVAPDWSGVGPIATGSMGPAKAGHPFFKIWSYWQMECINHMMTSGDPATVKDPFGWSELLAFIGTPLAQHMIRNKVLKLYEFNGKSTIGQLLLTNYSMFTPLEKLGDLLTRFRPTPILAILHKQFAAQLDGLTLRQLLYPENGDTTFLYFVKCALTRCTNLLLSSPEDDVGESTVGKVNISEYVRLLSTPLVHRCYKFNNTIVQKV